jgi:hypothetical protein
MNRIEPYTLRPIGVVRSTLSAPADAPNQAFEGAPEATLEIEPIFIDALHRIQVGDELILVTWLHLADRDTQPKTRTSRSPASSEPAPPTAPTRSASTASPSPHSKAPTPYASAHWRRSTEPRSSTSRSRWANRRRPSRLARYFASPCHFGGSVFAYTVPMAIHFSSCRFVPRCCAATRSRPAS